MLHGLCIFQYAVLGLLRAVVKIHKHFYEKKTRILHLERNYIQSSLTATRFSHSLDLLLLELLIYPILALIYLAVS